MDFLCFIRSLFGKKPEPKVRGKRDLIQTWKDEISGVTKQDSCNFMGRLNGLAYLPNWKDAFTGLENGEGFVDKLDTFFLAHKEEEPSTGQWSLYFSPRPRNTLPRDQLLGLAKLHIDETANLAKRANEGALYARIKNCKFVYLKTGEKLPNDFNEAEGLVDEVGDLWISATRISDRSHIHDCIYEACYGLVSDPMLERYLKSDFFDKKVNLKPYYDLWVGGGWISYGAKTIFVGTAGK